MGLINSTVQWVGQMLTLRSPDMLAPAKIPVAAGKNTANTVKKFSLEELPSDGRKSGPILSAIV